MAKTKTATNPQGAGRPTKLSNEIIDALCECIELGMTYRHSCDCATINYDTFCSWRNKAKTIRETIIPSKRTADETRLVSFSDSIKAAEAKGIQKNLKCIRKAADGDMENRPQWQAGAWLLERRHPEQFAKHEKIDQKTEHSGGVLVQLKMTDCSKKEDE